MKIAAQAVMAENNSDTNDPLRSRARRCRAGRMEDADCEKSVRCLVQRDAQFCSICALGASVPLNGSKRSSIPGCIACARKIFRVERLAQFVAEVTRMDPSVWATVSDPTEDSLPARSSWDAASRTSSNIPTRMKLNKRRIPVIGCRLPVFLQASTWLSYGSVHEHRCRPHTGRRCWWIRWRWRARAILPAHRKRLQTAASK